MNKQELECENLQHEITAWEEFQFLWNKWKYCDSLLYQRIMHFFTFQGPMLAIIGTLVTISIRFSIKGLGTTASILLIIIGIFGFVFYRMSEADLNVRNAFNKRIVKILLQYKVLSDEDAFDLPNCSAFNPNHAANLWHTPNPSGEGHGVRASKYVLAIFFWFSVLEIVGGGIGFLYFFALFNV